MWHVSSSFTGWWPVELPLPGHEQSCHSQGQAVRRPFLFTGAQTPPRAFAHAPWWPVPRPRLPVLLCCWGPELTPELPAWAAARSLPWASCRLSRAPPAGCPGEAAVSSDLPPHPASFSQGGGGMLPHLPGSTCCVGPAPRTTAGPQTRLRSHPLRLPVPSPPPRHRDLPFWPHAFPSSCPRRSTPLRSSPSEPWAFSWTGNHCL